MRRVWVSIKGYLFAIAAIAGALGLTFWLAPWLPPNPFTFFVAAIGVSAWYFGIEVGLFSSLLASLVTNYFFIPPILDLTFGKQDLSNLALFMLITAITVSLMRSQRLALESRAQLGAIVTSSEDAIIGVSLDGKVSSWNVGAGRIYGYSAQEMVGKPLLSIIPAEDQGKMRETLTQVQQGESTGRMVTEHPREPGQAVITSITFSPIQDAGGKITGVSLIARDITERRRLEAANRQRAAQMEVQRRLLDQREQERQQIAHDLHDGPVQELTAATFTLRGILMSECAPELVPQLEGIQASLQAQIDELRTYASELRPPTLAKFGLEKAVRSHAEIFLEKHPDLTIRLELAPIEAGLQETSGLALFRIYQQSLANILKHTQAKEVRVRLAQIGEQVQLEIQDNGQGFEVPEEWLGLVRKGHLGLVGMRERAEAVGGRLEVISQPGQGTLIQARVPLQIPSGF
jgi:PAS domain S-box-containing protein